MGVAVDILLDTHVVAHLLGAAGRRVAPRALDILSDPRQHLWVSSVSAYELISKVRLGTWPQAETIALGWMDRIADLEARPLSLDMQDMITAAGLMWEHRDPFDRMLAAQVVRRGWVLASADRVFSQLPGLRLIPC